MNSYTDLDGVPSAARPRACSPACCATPGASTAPSSPTTSRSRSCRRCTASPATWGEAAAAALDGRHRRGAADGQGLRRAAASTRSSPARSTRRVVDRALRRVLAQKAELGLLDADWTPVPPALRDADLGDPERCAAPSTSTPPRTGRSPRRLAEEAIVLLAQRRHPAPRRAGAHRRDRPERRRPVRRARLLLVPVARRGAASGASRWASSIPTLLEALRAEFPAPRSGSRAAPASTTARPTGIADAVALAASADVAIARPRRPRRPVRPRHERRGLRRRVPRRCRARSRHSWTPCSRRARPTVLVLLAGRPYALGRAATERGRRSSQAFFAGEEGATAIAGVLSGRVNPSGRLPVSVPATAGDAADDLPRGAARAATRRVEHRPDGRLPVRPRAGLHPRSSGSRSTAMTPRSASDGETTVRLRLRNAGDRSGTEIVQLYLHDPVASVVRPVQRLIGFTRVDLEPGQGAAVRFTVPADLASFTVAARASAIVEPGELVLGVGPLERRRAVHARGAAHGRDARRRPHPPDAPRGRGRGRARGIRDPRRRVTDPARRRRRPGRSPTRPAAAPCCRAPRGAWRGPCAASSRAGSSARRSASRVASSPMRRSGWCTVVSCGLIQRGERDVVVADDREVVGHAQAGRAPGGDHAERLQVAAGEDRRRRLGQGEQLARAARRRRRGSRRSGSAPGRSAGPPRSSPSGSRRRGRASTSCPRAR